MYRQLNYNDWLDRSWLHCIGVALGYEEMRINPIYELVPFLWLLRELYRIIFRKRGS